jgi:hypothetical protein
VRLACHKLVAALIHPVMLLIFAIGHYASSRVHRVYFNPTNERSKSYQIGVAINFACLALTTKVWLGSKNRPPGSVGASNGCFGRGGNLTITGFGLTIDS